jgi:hypothetical protein
MTPEESSIIRDVFNRIRSAGPIPNDPQARAMISQEMIANPDAGIGLIQLIVGLEAQRAQAVAERDRLAAQLQNSGQPQSSGGLFTRATPAYAAPPPPPPPQQGSPWANQPPPQPSPWGSQPQQPAQGGSFLRTALGSAAGVAGGLFAFDALSSMFGGHRGMGGGLFGGSPTEYISETTYINEGGSGTGSYDDSGSFDTASDDSSFFDNSSDDSSFG